MRVYVAGPMGGQSENISVAIKAATKLLDAGLSPYVPHLTYYWDVRHARARSRWMTLDLEWLKVCDCLLRLPGDSEGADQEVAWAKELGIPVYMSMDAVIAKGRAR